MSDIPNCPSCGRFTTDFHYIDRGTFPYVIHEVCSACKDRHDGQ